MRRIWMALAYGVVGLVGAGVSLVVGGCGLSREAQARQDDWYARAERAIDAASEGKPEESSELLAGLWKQAAVSPQPEGGIAPRTLPMGTVVVMRNEKVRPLLEPRLRGQLAELERKVVEGRADEHETEVWYDLVGTLWDRESMARVVEAGRANRAVVKPLLEPRYQREALIAVLTDYGRGETARVLELTDGEAFAQGAEDVLRFGSMLTPGLLATY